jgi:2,4-dienoyl-CoA reductase-like NADH-dependent reductase (Old Yellow Enzyme family)
MACRELAGEEIYELVEQYVAAARRIVAAGFDAVQLHGAHSWLLSAFLSPVTNRRQDEWGGSVEKRARFVSHIIGGIRRMAGPDYPILIKIGMMDYHRDGRTLEEGIETARILEGAGLDAIEISEGIEEERGHHIRQDAMRPYYKPECEQARKALKLPLMLVGGMRAKADMQVVLDEGIADAVSMCRPFVRDTAIVKKLREGRAETSDCDSCNRCIGHMHGGKIHCVLAKEA